MKQLYIDVQPECEKQMVLDYGYLENMDELAELTIHDKYLPKLDDLGNEEGYEEPLNPLPLLSGYGHENSFQGFTMRDGKVFAKYCFDSQDTLLTDMEIYEYRDDEWQYVLYTTDQKDCFGVYDFVNDSFTVYTWRYTADDKGEYVKRWGNTLSDIFVHYNRIPYDEGEDGYKWITIVNPYYLYPDVSIEELKSERREISANEGAISAEQALDMIYEQYYGDYSCDKIFFDEDVRTVYEDVLGCKMPEYAYRIEIGGIPYFLQISQVRESVYEFYTYGFDYGKKEFVREDYFQVDSLTDNIVAYLDR